MHKENSKEHVTTILALYPNGRGFGYVCLELPEKKLLDSGVITISPMNNNKILKRIAKFVDFFRPTILIVRDYKTSLRQSQRISMLIEEIAKYGKEIKVPVHRYTRQQIKDAFEQFGAKSKYEIAHRIIPWFPQLKFRVPQVRKPWKDEDYQMGVFDALSLIVTHQYLTE